MKKTVRKHRIIALFLALNFIQSLMPYNVMFANNNGPKAPEAGSFEPTDATDMVNLLSGDLSYVLPLLNVPGPEGGYPINLAYHAGVSLDQESSWTGLGWNLNPGAINRSVNGFPDDYKSTKFHEYFYDEGGSASEYSLSVGYGDPSGVASVGLGFSWGSNKALGGSVSLGYGPAYGAGFALTVGSEGASVGVGYNTGSLSFGISANTSGSVSGNVGLRTENGSGFKVSAGNNGYNVGMNGVINKNSSLGINYSDHNIQIFGSTSTKNNTSMKGGGTGFNFAINNSIAQGDYEQKLSGYLIPVYVPTPIGTFSASFGKQKLEWNMNIAIQNSVSGPLYFDENQNFDYRVLCEKYNPYAVVSYELVATYAQAIALKNTNENSQPCNCNIRSISPSFMDVYEFPIDNQYITNLDENNAILPNLDNYNVQAQGIGGNISLRFFENGNLYSLTTKQTSLYTVDFVIDDNSTNESNNAFTFDSKPEFYFENEFSSYLGTQPAEFNLNFNENLLLDHHLSSSANGLDRRTVSRFIEYFTNSEIFSSDESKYNRGYIEPKELSQISNVSDNAIGAFTVTSIDGTNYHYSIPVYNHATVSRTIGSVKDSNNNSKAEEDSYFEKIQDEPYATHWLLTSITGPDYIDLNNNHKVDDNDYGYWVEFDYGRWSDAFAWKIPYGKDYIISNDDGDIKIDHRGFKEVYYLDAIKTRTHTALFIKSLRFDSESVEWNYKSVNWGEQQNSGDFVTKFNIPKQQSLKLDKIILLKNADLNDLDFDKSTGNMPIEEATVSIGFPIPNSASKTYHYNRENYVFDGFDIPNEIFSKATKVIDLNYRIPAEGLLVRNSPNTSIANYGRLTLKSVVFNGKGNVNVMPPYLFDYYNEHQFNLSDENDFGYHSETPWDWSLKSIQSPEGSTINLEYESDDFFEPVIQGGKLFTRGLSFTFFDNPPTVDENSTNDPEDAPESDIIVLIENDSDDPFTDNINFRDYFSGDNFYMDLWFSAIDNFPGNGYNRSTININGQQATVLERTPSYLRIKVKASSPFFNRQLMHQEASPVSLSHGGEYSAIPFPHYKFENNEKKGRFDLAWVEESGNGNYRYSLSYKIIGNKDLYNQTNGDLRIKEISVSDGANIYKTKYYYNQLGYNEDPSNSNYRSSGTVSYIPDEDNSLIPYSSELPAPKVMYEYVTTNSFDLQNKSIGKMIYHFNVMKTKSPNEIKFGDFYEISSIKNQGVNNNAHKDIDFSQILIRNNLSSIGQLLDVETFNSKNQKISRIENEYFAKENRINDQGIDQESFQSYKEIDYFRGSKKDKWLINSSTKINYSSALKSTRKVYNNFSFITDFNYYDGITGSVLEATTINSAGTIVKTKAIPAYTISEFSGEINGFGMGSKVVNITNKNMLSQTAVDYSFIKKSGDWKPIGVGITTWSNIWWYRNLGGLETTPTYPDQKIWRKSQTYNWDGEIDSDGIYIDYNLSNFDGFNWGAQSQSGHWKKISQIKRYDHYSLPLEVMDINNNFASTKTGDKDSKIIATSNAMYTEMYYSGAEYYYNVGDEYFDGEVSGSFRSMDRSHTGDYSVKVSVGQQGFGVEMKKAGPRGIEHRPGKYMISVWANKENYQSARININGTSIPFNGEIMGAGNWVQMNHYFDIPNSTDDIYISVSSAFGTVYFDDFRISPVSASMSSFVYNKFDELTFTLGSNNLGTKYQYDESGKLIRVYVETIDTPTISGGFKLVKEYRYNYKGGDDNGGGDCDTTIHLTDIWNDDEEGPSTANLIFGNAGTEVTYTITTERKGAVGNVSGDFTIGSDNFVIWLGTTLITSTETHTSVIPSSGILNLSVDHINHPREGRGESTLTIVSIEPSTICIEYPNILIDIKNAIP